jgi:hypothetical protein
MKIDIIKYILISAITIIMIGGIVTAGSLITDRATKVIPEAKVIAELDDVTVENYEDKVIEKGVLATERETITKLRIAFNEQTMKCLQGNNYTLIEDCTVALRTVNNRRIVDTPKDGEVVEEQILP